MTNPSLIALATFTVTVGLSAEDWPQWRGRANTGASSEARLPLKWTNTENIAWKARLSGAGVSSPIVAGERVFATSQVGSGGSRQGPRLGQGAEANPAERSLSPASRSGTSTNRAGFRFRFAMFDDGVIYLSRGYRSGPYAAIRPGGRGDISKSHVIWHVPTGAPYISSLVHYQGWRQRVDGVFTASPVAGDGKIYFVSESGETIVLKAGREPEVLARNTIDGRILASPAISGGRLFIRTDDTIIAIGIGT
jgi:outer membrane protein assembly factor BamB